MYSGVVREQAKKAPQFKNHKKFSGFKKIKETRIPKNEKLFHKIDSCVEHGPKSNHRTCVLNENTWRRISDEKSKPFSSSAPAL